MPFANYIRNSSSLSQRHRELLILRTAWLSRSPYYWSVHSARAAAAGLTRADLTRIAAGPGARDWDPFEATLCAPQTSCTTSRSSATPPGRR